MMRVKKLSPDAIIPTRAHAGDAGLDVYSTETITIEGNGDAVIPTGISIAIPEGWVCVVKEKSGRAVKNKLTLGACVIDSGYRGEVFIHLFNNGDEDVVINVAESVAQLVVFPCWCGQPKEVYELNDTDRGDGKFGSTGLHKEG